MLSRRQTSGASASAPSTPRLPLSTTPSSHLDRPVPKDPGVVSDAAFALLFSEAVRYAQSRSDSVAQLESTLSNWGFEVGRRAAQLVASRDRSSGERRDTKMVAALQSVTSTCWTSLFGTNADALERSSEGPDTFLIHEKEPLPCKYASVPRDMGGLNLAAFNAGVIRGLLDAQGFPAVVTAHYAEVRGVHKTVYVVKFPREFVDREQRGV